MGVLQAVLQLKDDFSPQLSRMSAQIAKAAKAAAVAIASAAAATAVALFAATKEALAFADAIDNQSQATQVGVESLQLYNAAAERAGQGPAAVTTAIQRMQRAIGEGTAETDRAIANLGLSVAQLKSLAPEDQFELVLERLGDIPNEAEKAANAMILLGRSGGNLLALTGDALPKLRDQMEELGLVIDQDTIAAVDRLEEDIDLLARTATGTWRQLGAGIATSESLRAVVLLLTDSFGSLNRAMRDNGDTIRWWVNFVIGAFANAVLVSGNMMSVFDANVQKLTAVLQAALTTPFDALKSGQNPFAGLGQEFGKIDQLAANSRTIMKGWVDGFVIGARDAAGAIGGGAGGGPPPPGGGGSIADSVFSLDQMLKQFAGLQKFERDVAAATARINSTKASTGEWEQALARAEIEAAKLNKSVIVPLRLAGELTDEARQQQDEYNRALQEAANLAQIIPGILGEIVSQTFAATSALTKLSSASGGLFGGLKGAFSTGAGGKGGILGLLGGIGGLAGAAGPLVNIGVQLGGALVKGISSLFKSGPNLVRDAARDMGATITKEMVDAIEESGRPLQLAVADLFKAGAFESVDRFAQEIGDIFSGLESGAFGKPEAIQALEEAVPLLLQNLQELGPAGEEEIQRIIAAADRLGVEFDGLSDLINSTFAPQTLEEMKESLGLTGEEVRALADKLGIDLQTNLERAASQMGLTVNGLKALQEAAGTALGQEGAASLEEMQALMEATGLSAQDLAERLGVDAAGGAGSVAEEAAKGTAEISAAADQASRLTTQLLSAAQAASGIRIPSGIGGDGGALPPGLAHGGFVRANPPFGTTVRLGEREDEFAIPRSRLDGGGGGGGGGGGTVIQKVEVNVSVQGNILSTEEEIAAAIEGPTSRLILQSPEIQRRIRDAVE